jgi:ribosomal RNA assembly protein
MLTKDFVKIPRERLAIIIGHSGTVKKELEKRTCTKLTITDDVEIEGEAVDVLLASSIVKAIARGFSPENAFLLMNEEYELNIITMEGHSDKLVKRLMGRVIGREGRTRKKIEDSCGARISIYGKTVAIISKLEQSEAAMKCIEALLVGKMHGYAYRIMNDLKKR